MWSKAAISLILLCMCDHVTCARTKCWGAVCIGEVCCQLPLFTFILHSDDDYEKSERPDDFVKVLVSPMLGEVFKVRKLYR